MGKDPLKILFLGNTNNKGFTLSRALRKQGLIADAAIVLDTSKRDFHRHDVNCDFIYKHSDLRISKFSTYFKRALKMLKYDILHTTHGLPENPREYKVLKTMRNRGKKLFIYYNGDDILKGTGIAAQDLANGLFVSTPDLLDCKSDYELKWMPNPIDISSYSTIDKPESKTITILHANGKSKRMWNRKGTDLILKTIKKLKSRYNIGLLFIENLPYKEAIKLYPKADLVVDQLNVGWYGIFAMETMLMGLPTMCYIRDDLPKNPLINTTKNTLAEDLSYLIEQKDDWKKIGLEQRNYVKRVHDVNKLAKQWSEIYLNN
jgi:glycosyltransferase involved in cell wall biosynthesis